MALKDFKAAPGDLRALSRTPLKDNTNKSRMSDAQKNSKRIRDESYQQKQLLNSVANTQRLLNEGTITGKQKEKTKKALRTAMEGYSLKDIREIQKTQAVSPLTIKTLKQANLLQEEDSDSGLLEDIGSGIADAGSWGLQQIMRPGQAVMSAVAQYVKMGERQQTLLPSGLDKIGKAAVEGFELKRHDTPTSITNSTARIRRRQGRDDNLFGFIDPKDMTTGVGGFATDFLGSVALDPLTYLSFGATSVGKATARQVGQITVKHAGIKSAGLAAEMTGRARAGQTIANMGKTLAEKGVESPAIAAWTDDMLDLAKRTNPKGLAGELPNMSRGIRYTPLKLPFVGKKVDELAVKFPGQTVAEGVEYSPGFLTRKADALASGRVSGQRAFNAWSNTIKSNPTMARIMKNISATARAGVAKAEARAANIARTFGKLSPRVHDAAEEMATNHNFLFHNGELYDDSIAESTFVSGQGWTEAAPQPVRAGDVIVDINGVRHIVDEASIKAAKAFRQLSRDDYEVWKGAGLLSDSGIKNTIPERYVYRTPSESVRNLPSPSISKSALEDNQRLPNPFDEVTSADPLRGRRIDPNLSIAEINKQWRKGTLVARDEATGRAIPARKWEGFESPESRDFDFFETNAEKIATQSAKSTQNIRNKVVFTQEAKNTGAMVVLPTSKKGPEGWAKVENEQTRKIMGAQEGEDVFVPQEVVTDMERLTKITERGAFGEAYDRYLQLWKAYATVPFPFGIGFTLRNGMGNYIASYMEGTTLLADYAHSFRLQRLAQNLKQNDPSLLARMLSDSPPADLLEQLAKRQGRKSVYSWKQSDIDLFHDAYQEGVISDQFMYADLGPGTDLAPLQYGQKPTIFNKALKKTQTSTLSPLNPSNKILGLGTQINAGVENNARLAHFIAKRTRSGSTVEEAAQSVRKYLFDYADLSNTERRLFKKVSPFYTFTRKSIPLYAAEMLSVPGKFNKIQYAQRALAGRSRYEAEDIAPWMKQAGGVPLPRKLVSTLGTIPAIGGNFAGSKDAVWMPDLPFKQTLAATRILTSLLPGGRGAFSPENLRDLTSVFGIAGPAQVPLLLMELKLEKQGFTGASLSQSDVIELPSYLKPFQPLLQSVGAIHSQSLSPGGKKKVVISKQSAYLLEQLFPGLPKMRTLFFPSKEDESAAGRRALSLATGQSVYPITESAKGTAYKSDTEELRRTIDENKSQGFYAPETEYVKPFKKSSAAENQVIRSLQRIRKKGK